MTSHGFGIVRVSSAAPTAAMIDDLAKQISQIRPVVWAHVVSDKNERYSIAFEFDELNKACYEMKHAKLQEIIGEVSEKYAPGHQIAVELWVIRRSYHNGC